MSPRPKQNTQQENLRDRIKETAWKQIAEKGAAALSLRAIARELGITAPAIYNYFTRRDDLVTALIVDAFTSFGQAQKESDNPERTPAERLRILGTAYRDWAMKYPQRYHLIFGTPIPGYHAPAEITLPAAAGSLIPLMGVLNAGLQTGKLKLGNLAPKTPALSSMLDAWKQNIQGPDVEVLYLAIVIASRVHGLVSMEIGEQMPGFIVDPGEVYRREVENILYQYLEE
jgi:AcrR family transcriptional regulator